MISVVDDVVGRDVDHLLGLAVRGLRAMYVAPTPRSSSRRCAAGGARAGRTSSARGGTSGMPRSRAGPSPQPARCPARSSRRRHRRRPVGRGGPASPAQRGPRSGRPSGVGRSRDREPLRYRPFRSHQTLGAESAVSAHGRRGVDAVRRGRGRVRRAHGGRRDTGRGTCSCRTRDRGPLPARAAGGVAGPVAVRTSAASRTRSTPSRRWPGSRRHADADALDAANRCAAPDLRPQGTAGQWWWHYDVRDGSVVEGYPVYSVHQHAMAPDGALRPARGGGDDHRRVHRARVALAADPPGGARRAGRRAVSASSGARSGAGSRRKAVRKLNAVTTVRARRLHVPGLDRLCPPTVIDHECRPYELGWLLYAWQRQRRPHADDPRPRRHSMAVTSSAPSTTRQSPVRAAVRRRYPRPGGGPVR